MGSVKLLAKGATSLSLSLSSGLYLTSIWRALHLIVPEKHF